MIRTQKIKKNKIIKNLPDNNKIFKIIIYKIFKMISNLLNKLIKIKNKNKIL